MSSKPWHRADVVAALHKRDTSLAQLARENGLAEATLRAALSYPRKPSNQIIADFLGKKLHEVWPHWFTSQGVLTAPSRSPAKYDASSQKRPRKLTMGGSRV